MRKIVMGSDKSGFNLKEAVKAHLLERGFEVVDCGTKKEEEPIPYFKVASILAKTIQEKECERGILICGTGMGMSVVANKFKGVYAAVCESTYAAEKCRAINDANVLTMGGWVTADILGCEMVDKFLDTGFTEGLEEWRQEFLKKARAEIETLENQIYD